MTFFRREVDGALLIFINGVESRLCGYDGVHEQIFAHAKVAP